MKERKKERKKDNKERMNKTVSKNGSIKVLLLKIVSV